MGADESERFGLDGAPAITQVPSRHPPGLIQKLDRRMPDRLPSVVSQFVSRQVGDPGVDILIERRDDALRSSLPVRLCKELDDGHSNFGVGILAQSLEGHIRR